ncbi:V-type ATP synthase subunit F [Acholeplasma equifetale]|uniref:V-type ATP synthase subunit F n=1 Tax=Acholeplasma equifetale TaxID=264634 RepID=UPI00047CF9EC|nr:V-type ATP synthase subunit F [Acholeplasma equifetale]
MKDIKAISTNSSFLVLTSIGIDVEIVQKEELKKAFQKSVKDDFKIVIYDKTGEEILNEMLDRYDESLYPIFLKLPTGLEDEDTLLELKRIIEKSIGISII